MGAKTKEKNNNHKITEQLRERVKELTCLYGIAKIVDKPDIKLDEILQDVAQLLPPAFLHPEAAFARIILSNRSYSTAGFNENFQKLAADIVVRGRKKGVIEVAYGKKESRRDIGPFLKEERKLLDTVAQQVSLIIERKLVEEDKLRLADQLRHADRLATIGQLAAGVAHELNEPLANILGFAQLAAKNKRLPKRVFQDIDKIVATSLHAREIVKKLLLFARQMPPNKTKINLNKLIKEGLYFVRSRCAKSGIEIIQKLSHGIPEIVADSSQLYQVLVNLVVNAVQAMPQGGQPQGGKLIIKTFFKDNYVSLVVEDTGAGMTQDVLKQIFMPFFTTKEIDQGTGLGLAVVHGIVSSHGGKISVDTKLGKGSAFEIKLPVKE